MDQALASTSDVTVTHLLHAWRDGDQGAENELMNVIYPLLKVMSRRHLRANAGTSIRATELLHESYERLRQQQLIEWEGQSHFYAIASTVMRRVLVDHHRSRNAAKRGGDAIVVDIDSETVHGLFNVDSEEHVDWLALDEALNHLKADNAVCVQVFDMHIFGGRELKEVADVLKLSYEQTLKHWRFARAYLSEALS